MKQRDKFPKETWREKAARLTLIPRPSFIPRHSLVRLNGFQCLPIPLRLVYPICTGRNYESLKFNKNSCSVKPDLPEASYVLPLSRLKIVGCVHKKLLCRWRFLPVLFSSTFFLFVWYTTWCIGPECDPSLHSFSAFSLVFPCTACPVSLFSSYKRSDQSQPKESKESRRFKSLARIHSTRTRKPSASCMFFRRRRLVCTVSNYSFERPSGHRRVRFRLAPFELEQTSYHKETASYAALHGTASCRIQKESRRSVFEQLVFPKVHKGDLFLWA